MRKTILGNAELAAIGARLTVGSAADAYTVDTKGVRCGRKCEVRSHFGLNNAAMTTSASGGLRFDSRSLSRVEQSSVA
jgi:hypothetical protein